ncbi:hypothetical protein [Blautia sp. 1033sp1_1033st1_G9_1033SCRN_220408]|jgi:hypothetical protein|uniref:hypothetical protein n=1 Tax=Blautia sp. 1033sp1_1033st1_G9_1033SCRN_220408 TaxID=3144490 RepID=UPI0034A2169C
MNKEIWAKKIRYIRSLKDEELIRLESFSVIVSFMLSKEVFKVNSELKEFMNELGMDCKPYLVKSRTAMLAKTVRVFEKAEKQQLFYYIDIINKRIDELPEEEKNVQVNKKSKKNYMKEVLELYGRKDK